MINRQIFENDLRAILDAHQGRVPIQCIIKDALVTIHFPALQEMRDFVAVHLVEDSILHRGTPLVTDNVNRNNPRPRYEGTVVFKMEDVDLYALAGHAEHIFELRETDEPNDVDYDENPDLHVIESDPAFGDDGPDNAPR